MLNYKMFYSITCLNFFWKLSAWQLQTQEMVLTNLNHFQNKSPFKLKKYANFLLEANYNTSIFNPLSTRNSHKKQPMSFKNSSAKHGPL